MISKIVVVVFLAGCLADELIQVQIFRHGDRTPMETYPNDPYKDKLWAQEDPGQLTNVGKQKQYELGQWIRSRYSSFLPSKYSYTHLKVISDDMDRCLMSAGANLAGLYAPEAGQIWNQVLHWQPIPIHTNLALLEGSASNCPRNDALLDKVLNTPTYQAIDQSYTDVYKYLTLHSGKNVTNLMGAWTIRDVMYIESVLGWELPSWTKEVYPKPLDQISASFFQASTANKEIAQLNVGPLFTTLTENFNATEKMIYYSAHDSNIVDVLHVLAPTFPIGCPKFASSLFFELWQKNSLKYVKLYVKNGDTLSLVNIQNCGTSCELNKLNKILAPYSLTLKQKEQICNS
ncbi:prostatic acid phosphatase isoform X2 [Aethina tumida]|uniref:prostatic acid phosphatase isoform X2 n=1 Tax=Aethina tumida TaxID=116153 RepID=UPI00214897FF|nr:prostatic acid phosphatase isoform X2 [Aethina tumida]